MFTLGEDENHFASKNTAVALSQSSKESFLWLNWDSLHPLLGTFVLLEMDSFQGRPGESKRSGWQRGMSPLQLLWPRFCSGEWLKRPDRVSLPTPWGGGRQDSWIRSCPCSHDSSGKRVGILEAGLEGKLCAHASVHVCVLHTYCEAT